MYIYKLYRGDSDTEFAKSVHLQAVIDEVKIDLLRNNRFVEEQFRGGFKVVSKDGKLRWLRKFTMEDEELITYQSEDDIECRIEKTRAFF